ncbi:male sterility protein domain-containing protein [Phthorimaea operculella]|nr:male sterility protein domain-containing protein [Phthorimaea operculella]
MDPAMARDVALLSRRRVIDEAIARGDSETEIIFHGAATINFNEPLRVAINTNVRGTVEMLKIGKHLIKNWPNTYTFTKAIAEEACRQAGSELPISIVRPAIGAVTAKNRSEGDSETKIYTFTSIRNGITWRGLLDLMFTDFQPTIISPKAPYYIFSTQTSNPIIFFTLSWLWHFIPAYIIDGIMYCMGKTPMAVKLYTKMATHTKVLSFFMTNSWNMKDNKLQQLYSSLSSTDKLIFNCDIATVNWRDLLMAWTLGIPRFFGFIKCALEATVMLLMIGRHHDNTPKPNRVNPKQFNQNNRKVKIFWARAFPLAMITIY